LSTRIVAVGSTTAQRACDAPCHIRVTLNLAVRVINRLPHNQPGWCQLDRNCDQPTSTTTNAVDDTAYSSARAASWTRTTVADGHKFSTVRHLSRRLLDRSKNAIFTVRRHASIFCRSVSGRPSVRPSVASRYCTKTAKRRIMQMQTTPQDSSFPTPKILAKFQLGRQIEVR